MVKLVEDKNNKLRTLVMPNLSYGSSRLSYGIMIGIVKKTGGYIKMKSDFGSISSEEEVDKNTVDTYWYNAAPATPHRREQPPACRGTDFRWNRGGERL